MIEADVQIRKFGDSMAVIIPRTLIRKERLREGETVHMLINKKRNVLSELFGTVKFKRSTQEMLDELDREGWDDSRQPKLR